MASSNDIERSMLKPARVKRKALSKYEVQERRRNRPQPKTGKKKDISSDRAESLRQRRQGSPAENQAERARMKRLAPRKASPAKNAQPYSGVPKKKYPASSRNASVAAGGRIRRSGR